MYTHTPHCVLQWTLDGKGNKKAKVKKGQGQGIKGRQHQSKKPMAQRRVAPPHSSSESSEGEEGADEEEGDNQVSTLHVVSSNSLAPSSLGGGGQL